MGSDNDGCKGKAAAPLGVVVKLYLYRRTSQSLATSHLMRPLGPDCGAYTSASLPVFFRPLCQLRSDGVIPRQLFYSQICSRFSRWGMELTNFEIVLVGQLVGHQRHLWHYRQDLLTHDVHGVLHTRALVLGKGLHRDTPRLLPRLVKLGRSLLDLLQARKRLPCPAAVHVSAEDAVPDLGQGGELVAHEAVEGGAGALEHGQTDDAGLDGNASLAVNDGLDIAGLLAVTEEGVRVGLAVDDHTGPPVDDELDVGGVDVRVGIQEVLAQRCGEEFWRVDRVLLGLDVDGVLHGVRGDHHTVVGFCVSRGGCLLVE